MKSKSMISSLRSFSWNHRKNIAKLALVGFGCVLVTLFFYAALATRYDLKKVAEVPDRSVVYDTNDQLYSRLSGEDRIVISRDELPKYFVQALLAREDQRFYRHHGIDYLGILRAIVHN